MVVLLRAAVGLVVGLIAGGIIAAMVVLTKFGPIVSTPRSFHATLLILIFLIPATAGLLIALVWPRR